MKARALYLYGKLGKELGRKHTIYVESVAEAMRYLAANFGDKFYASIKEGYYKIKKVAKETTDFIGEKSLTFALGEGDIYIIPVAKGAASQRSKQVGMVVAGVALAAVTFGAGAAIAASAGTIGSFGAAFTTTAGASAALAATGWVGAATFSLAASLALQGIAGLLTPIPKVKSQEGVAQNAGSSASIQNTFAEGSTIPVIYGKVKVGSVVISSGVYAEQMATDTQYSVVMNYLKEYVTNMELLISAYQTAIATTSGSPDTVMNKNGGYSYYPGKYPHIATQLQAILDSLTPLLANAKTLQEQSVTTFSLTDYTNLVDATLARCNQAEPVLLSLYDVVGEVCDFYVVDDVYRLSKISMSYIGKVRATSYGVTNPSMRTYDDNRSARTYHSYYASTRTDNTVRRTDTLTPLDSCYFMTGVMRYVLTTLKEKENW